MILIAYKKNVYCLKLVSGQLPPRKTAPPPPPPVSAKVWFRVRVRIRVRGGIFLGGNYPRTLEKAFAKFLFDY